MSSAIGTKNNPNETIVPFERYKAEGPVSDMLWFDICIRGDIEQSRHLLLLTPETFAINCKYNDGEYEGMYRYSLLHVACLYKQFALVEWLLQHEDFSEHGAAARVDCAGAFACSYPEIGDEARTQLIRVFLLHCKRSSDVETLTHLWFYCAASEVADKWLNMILLAAPNDFDLNTVDRTTGRAVLHDAVITKSNLAAINYLLKLPSLDLHAKGNNCHTPSSLAETIQDCSMALTLLTEAITSKKARTVGAGLFDKQKAQHVQPSLGDASGSKC